MTNRHTRRKRYVTTSVVIARISFHACDAGLQKCDSETVYNNRTAVTYSPIAMCDKSWVPFVLKRAVIYDRSTAARFKLSAAAAAAAAACDIIDTGVQRTGCCRRVSDQLSDVTTAAAAAGGGVAVDRCP